MSGVEPIIQCNRRLFLGALGASFFTTRGLFAEELLLPTPEMTEGPFYPDKLPLDQDNDLIIISDHVTPAVGEITHLTGRVRTTNGSPVKGASIEIWQCDANAVYLHTSDSRRKAGQRTRTSKDSDGSRRVRRENTAFGRSSRSPTLAARPRTFT